MKEREKQKEEEEEEEEEERGCHPGQGIGKSDLGGSSEAS
jgi:hypothetical protein